MNYSLIVILTILGFFVIILLAIIAKKYGNKQAENKQAEDKVDELKKDAEIAEDYRDISLDDARDRMWEKIRKHTS